MTDRDERALREALRGLEASEPVDPAAARRGADERRRHRQTLIGVVTVLVLVVGVAGIPRLLPGGGGEATSAGGAPAGAEQAPAGGGAAEDGPASPQADARVESGPDGWRTEYYRDISFRVPADWTYAMPPDPFAWCAGDGASGKLRPEQRSPYVWLRPEIIPRPAIACDTMPNSLLSEHVAALVPGPTEDFAGEPVRDGEWWFVGRYVGSAYLVVTTKDRSLGERIVESARIADADAPCAPTSPASALGGRPDPAHDLATLKQPEAAVLCQYEASLLNDETQPRLRAVARLDAAASAALASALAQGRPNTAGCATLPSEGRPQVSVQVDFVIRGEVRTVHVAAQGCPDGGGMRGGVDDGTTLRLLSRDACRALMTPPLAIYAAGGDVAAACLR